jgi:hypothetical protein
MECDEYEGLRVDVDQGMILTQGRPNEMPEVTVRYREREQDWPRQVMAEPVPHTVTGSRAYLASMGVTPEMVARVGQAYVRAHSSYRGIDRPTASRLRWDLQQPDPVTDILRGAEAIQRSEYDRVDALTYAAGWIDPRLRQDPAPPHAPLRDVTETPAERLQRAHCARAAAMGLVGLARAGRQRCDILLGALSHLGAIGRGVAIAMEHNYGSTLRGALLELR